MQKSKISYDLWLQMYKNSDVYTITLEQHIKWCPQFALWKKDNNEEAKKDS